MATYTEADIAALKGAMASGISEIRSASGEMIRYRTIDEALKLLALMEREVGSTSGTKRASFWNASFDRGL